MRLIIAYNDDIKVQNESHPVGFLTILPTENLLTDIKSCKGKKFRI